MITTPESGLFFMPEVPVKDDELQTQTLYVRPSRTFSDPADVTISDLMNVIEVSGTLDFWNDPQEDIYDESDGYAV